MAKIAFSKLKCKVNDDVKVIDFADEKIEIKQYLPIQEKLGLIGRVIMLSHEEDNNYSNPVKVNVFMKIEIVFAYTNINFTEKQKEDIPKLFDLMSSTGLLDSVLSAIPQTELSLIFDGVHDSIDAVYTYQNSVVGILDTLKENKVELNMEEVDKMQESLMNLAESPLMKNILPLLD